MLVNDCFQERRESAPLSPTKGVLRMDRESVRDNDIIVPALLHPDELGTIQPGRDKHFYSRGAFNLVQLVLYLLAQTGPADVFISSYSIAEDSLATLKRQVEKGSIRSIRFLIDNRVRTISPKPFDYLAGAFPGQYSCCALQAKVALLWNEQWQLSVVGSQNATHNPKLERGIIHTDPDVFQFDLQQLTHEFDDGTT